MDKYHLDDSKNRRRRRTSSTMDEHGEEVLAKNEKKEEKDGKKGKEEKKEDSLILSPQENKQIISSYKKFYCRTKIQSTKFEYNWEIDRFGIIFKIMDVLISAPFPETTEYKLKMTISRFDNVTGRVCIYLLARKEFTGLCDTRLRNQKEQIKSSVISGFIANKTLLCDTLIAEDDFLDCINTLYICCKFEMFDHILHDSIHMDLQSMSSKDLKSNNLSFDDNAGFVNTKSIEFMVNKKHYNIPMNLLYATNSTYFKNLCDKYEKTNISEELTVNNEPYFIMMLSYIKIGLIPETADYYIYENLLKIADQYDVKSLKTKCEHQLLDNISINTVLHILQLALSCKAEYLKKHAAMYMKFHMKEIIRTEEFKRLSQEESDNIMQLIHSFKNEITQRSASFVSISTTTCID